MRLLVFQQGPRRYFQRLAISLCASTALFASLTCPATSDEPAAPSKRSKPSQFAELTNPDNPIRKLFGDARLQLWSLQPITRPAVPTVRQQDWVWNPIDTFLLARWEDHKTDPLSQADHYRFRAFFAACQLDDKRPDLLLVRESVDKVEGTRVFYQGDHRQLREEVPPGFPSVLFPIPPEIPRPSHGKTTGRRTTLARWIGSEQNPWAARVLVNRLWQHHFGVGLVESPNDFGWTGSTPNNLPLLDYLACELMENGWSIKSVQRLILTSHAYRQIAVSDAMRTSAPQKAQWASPRRTLHRLRAEELRDAILSTSGLLSLEEVDKPVWPDLSQDILQTNPAILDDNKEKTKGWYPSPPIQAGGEELVFDLEANVATSLDGNI